VRHLRSFVRGAAGTGVAVTARAIGALVLNKLLALYGGPGGLTQLAQFQNLMALFGALPTDGVQVGATTYLAPLPPGTARHRLYLGAALWLTAGLVGLGGLLLALGEADWPVAEALIFTAAMLLVASQALLSAALLAAGRRAYYVALAVVLSAAGPLAVGGLLAAGRPVRQVLLGYVVGQALTAGLAVELARRAGMWRGWRPAWPRPVALRALLRFLLMALSALLFGRAVDYAVRAYLMAHFAPVATDRWQAVAKLADNYTLVVGALLSTVFYPRLAALAARPAEQRRYVSTVAGLLGVGLALGFGGLYLLRSWLLALLFAPRLAAAAPLLAPQLLGDWAKFLSWVFQYVLLVRARPLPYLAVQAASAALYAGLLGWLLPALGLPGVVLAHAARYGVLLLACLAWFYGRRARGVGQPQ
jgi:PST family polysaccharide transporter